MRRIALISERVIPMKCGTPRTRYLLFSLTVLSLLDISPVAAEEPTLVRLSFWIPPERMEEFSTAYAEQIAPVLKKHGLAVSPDRGRTTVDSVFSRLFAIETPRTARAKIEAVLGDSAYGTLLVELGSRFSSTESQTPIHQELVLYSVPAREGRSVPAGPGKTVLAGRGKGHWISYDETNGLTGGILNAIAQDSTGNIWFGTYQGGASRFDGVQFRTFMPHDGLLDDRITTIFPDKDGDIWFGTYSGVSRYDGTDFWTYTEEDGLAGNFIWAISQDSRGDLWLGTSKGASRFGGREFTNYTMEDGLPSNRIWSILQDRNGDMWFGTDVGISLYDGQKFTNYTTEDGLPDNGVNAILQDRQGSLWFATDGGISCYDGQKFTNYTTGILGDGVGDIVQDSTGAFWFATFKGLGRFESGYVEVFTVEDGLSNEWVMDLYVDREGNLWIGTFSNVDRYQYAEGVTFTSENGLPENAVWSLTQDRNGDMWFGTYSGACRYDGERNTTYTEADGLPGNRIFRMLTDRNGDLWFGDIREGICRYDGRRFTSFTIEDGFVNSSVWSLYEDHDGNIWIGTTMGVTRWDSERFTTFTIADGLADNWVNAILQDRQGNMWFGSGNVGLSRWDGKRFTTFTTADGLAGEDVRALYEDLDGHLWIGTAGDGIARWDGERFTTFTAADGLSGNWGWVFNQDRQGVLWVGSWSGGVSLWDGHLFQSLSQKDGLGSNQVRSLYEDRQGNMWIGTTGGATRFRRPAPLPPPVSIDAVVADRRYVAERKVSTSSNVGRVAFEFHGTSFKTRLDALVYRYRMAETDPNWQTTRARRVEYEGLPSGIYTFEVQAVDRDLVYSETPSTVHLTIHPPYERIALIGCLGLALLGAFVTTSYAVRKRRDLRRAEQALMHELEEELQVAHEMQMGLMPVESPEIVGFDIAGCCLPFNHVGGDLFQYFPQDGRLSICMADVTGHAMEAAVPVMMFSGVLKSQMELDVPLDALFGRLNRTMHDSLDSRTYVCFCMGELDIADRRFRLANAACPYPFHFRAATGEVEEMQVDAYPLGVRDGTVYTVTETTLELGDGVVFCSDGIIEAENAGEEMFGFERTAETIRQGCREDLSAEALIDHLIGAVKAFAGETPQGDDMTVVVLKVET